MPGVFILQPLAGPCREECSLNVYPQVADVSACQRCGQSQTVWHNKDYASLDLTVIKNYTRDSMLVGTAMTTIARSVTKSLQSNGLKVCKLLVLPVCGCQQSVAPIDRLWMVAMQAHCYVLMYEPQPDAAWIAKYKPLAMLALKAEGWDLSFTVSPTMSSAQVLWDSPEVFSAQCARWGHSLLARTNHRVCPVH